MVSLCNHKVRHTVQTVGLLGAAMMVTLVFGNRAEKMFAITGATGVCMACYVLPIALCHLEQHKKMSRWRRLGAEESSKPVRISVFDNIMSVLILLIGGSTSAFALWTSLFGTS